MRVSENSHSETVWKIAEGLSRVVHRRLETADRAPSTPIGRLRDPYFGIHPAFPNSFGETVWKSSATGQPPHHKTDHGSVDESLRAGAQPLVVFAHAPILA